MLSLDHFSLIASSEDTINYYKKLGFVEKNRIERGYDYVVFLNCNNACLEIFVDPEHPERLCEPEAKGLRYLAFIVDDIEKIDIEINEIQKDWFGRRLAYVKDPDGQVIQIIERNS